MAVIEGLPGIEVTIKVDGTALKEYEDKDEEELEDTVTRHVEAVSGKEFIIQVKMEKGFELEGDSLSFDCFTDGKLASCNWYYEEAAGKGHIVECEGYEDHYHLTKFRFDDIETVSDGHLMKGEAAKLQDIGTLKVVAWHSETAGVGPAEEREKAAELGILSGKALQGQTISHGIGKGTISARHMESVMWTNQVEVGEEFDFIFRYRSLAALKSMLIIPRTPTPPPLERRDFDSLSREELRELHRRAKDNMEAQEAEEAKRMIKRERAEENPRPRKVSRSSAGDTQLEIDDEGTVRESSTATLGRKEKEIIELD